MEREAYILISGFILFVVGFVYFAKVVLYSPPKNIFEAVREFRFKHVKKFIEKGVDINIRNLNGRTPLMIVCDKGTLVSGNGIYRVADGGNEGTPFEIVKMMKFLIDNGATFENKYDNGDTEVLRVSFSSERLKVLLDAGANVDAQNPEGRTALIKAARIGMEDSVELLLSYGADASIKDQYGKTAYDYAAEKNYKDTMKLLDSYC